MTRCTSTRSTGTAEKCHYCAHRTEARARAGLRHRLSRGGHRVGGRERPRVADRRHAPPRSPTAQRKVEKGTQPRVWYVDALDEALVPGAAREPADWLWSESPARAADDRVPTRAAADVVTTLNVDHPPVWGWHIWTYLTTKNVAAGAALMQRRLAAVALPDATELGAHVFPELVALVFLCDHELVPWWSRPGAPRALPEDPDEPQSEVGPGWCAGPGS